MMEFGKGRLKGVEVAIYQGADGGWNASVLLDKRTWGYAPDFEEPTHLPRRGNRPLTDTGSGRWWYDLSVGPYSYSANHHKNGWFGKNNSTPRNNADRLETLLFEVAQLIHELVPQADVFKILGAVNKVETPTCINYHGGAA